MSNQNWTLRIVVAEFASLVWLLLRSGSWGEQFNKQTAFIDASAVYGCHEVGKTCKAAMDLSSLRMNWFSFAQMVFAQEIALKLRGGSGRHGGLLVSNSQLPNFLPSNFDLKLKRAGTDKPTDFVAGDERVETQASLTSIQVKTTCISSSSSSSQLHLSEPFLQRAQPDCKSSFFSAQGSFSPSMSKNIHFGDLFREG